MEVLLECTDATARLHMGTLMKFVISKLKKLEADKLFSTETITGTDEKGEAYTIERPASLCSRFILKSIALLNTQVAKNWSRFESFLDVLSAFALCEEAD